MQQATEQDPHRVEVRTLERTRVPSDDKARASRGQTTIDDDVISVIARLAAEEVPGVHRLGNQSMRQMLSRLGRHHGVESEVGLEETAVDVEIVVEFGFPIREVAAELREQVIASVERMTGCSVVEVNIHVTDVHIPRARQMNGSRRELQ